VLIERGAIIAQRFRNIVSRNQRSQDAYYTERAKWNSRRGDYLVFRILRVRDEPEASG
jgi:hypothetical protein